MPHLIVTADALRGIDRCNRSLVERNATAARRAASAIAGALRGLTTNPAIGRPVQPDLRELVIPFSAAGYVALYRHVREDDAVVILAFRHQREGGY